MRWFKKLGVIVAVILLIGMAIPVHAQNTQALSEDLWEKTIIIISLDNIKTVGTNFDYIISSLPPEHAGIMIMWYGISSNYNADFNLTQKFIDAYKAKYPDKQIIELWLDSNLTNPQTNTSIHIKSPLLKGVTAVITFDDITKVIKDIPKNAKIHIIGTYLYEKQNIPVNGTNQTKVVVNEKPKWDNIVELKKEDPRFDGLMIYTNDQTKLSEIITRAKKEGFTTYTIILPNPRLFGGIDIEGTYQKIISSLHYYDYIMFYGWESLTPLLNYYMSGLAGKNSTNINGSQISVPKPSPLIYLPEILLLIVIVAGIVIVYINRKRGKNKNRTKTKLKTKEKDKNE